MESYKESCKRAVKKSRFSKYNLEEIKMQQRLDRIVREELKQMRVKVGNNNKKIKVSMQMMSGLASVATNFIGPVATGLYTAHQVNKYGKTILETKGKADDLLDVAKQTFSSADSLITKVSNILSAITDKVAVAASQDGDILAMIMQIVAALTQLTFTRPEKMIHSFVLSLSNIFFRFGMKKLWDWISSLLFKSSNISLQGPINFRTVLSKVVEYFGYAIAGLVGSLAIKEGIMSKTGVDLMRQIGSVCLVIKTVKDLDMAFPKIFNVLSNFLFTQFGIVPVDELDEIIDGYEAWKTNVYELMTRIDDESASDKISYDREFVIGVENLYKQGVELSKSINEKRVPAKIQKQFLILMKFMENLFKKTDMSGAFGGKPRTEPIIIWLYGEAGQGKSYISMPFAMMIAKVLNKHIPDDRLFAEIYMRNVEQEYWDGYTGQSVVIYDDFGQKVDSGSDANPEFMEIIRAGNIAPFPLHMASLEDKRRARFQSKAVILSSNIERPQINSLTFPDAFFRRITVQLKVVCKPEYCYEAKEGVFRASYAKIQAEMKNRGMAEDEMFTDCYQFIHTNPENPDEIKGVYNFEEVIEMLQEAALTKHRSTVNYINKCKNFAEKFNVALQGNEDFEDADDQQIVDALDLESDKYYLYNEVKVRGSTLIDAIIEGATIYTSEIKECVNKIAENFKRTADKISNEFKTYVSKVTKFFSENPAYLVYGALGTVVASATALGLWKYLSPGSDRVEIISDGLGCKKITRKDLLYGQIMRGEDKIMLTEKQYKNVKTELEAFCEQTDKTIQVCVVPEGSQSGDMLTKNSVKPKVELSQSGDNLTKHQLKKVVEGVANVSGDNITKAKATVRVENMSTVSGDNKTQQMKKIIVEGISNVSGDNLTRKALKTKIEVDSTPVEMQMWKDEQAQTLITNRIWSNLYRISGFISENEIKPLLNGLFVRSRCMLVPGHLLDFLYKYNSLYIENLTGESYTIPLEHINVIRITDRMGDNKEAALLVFPKTVKAHCDLVKHFSDGESMAMYRRADIALPLIRYGKSIGQMFATILGNTECIAYDKPVILDDSEKGEYVLRTGLRYKANTISGDCGAPVIVNETCVLRKIAGIHVAGAKDGSAFAESITQADLQRAFAHVGPNDKIIFDPDFTPNLSLFKFKSELQLDAHYEREDIISAFGLPAENFSFIGKASKTVFSGGQTTLRPSVIYGEVTDPTTKPCYLYHPEVDMYVKNLQKCAMKTPYIEGKDLDIAVADVKKKLFANTDRRLARVLTDEECIQGSDDSDYIGAVNRSTSAGYPWVLERAANTKGKQAWLGDGEYKYDPTLKKAVDERIARGKQGIRTPVVWTDTLKDERRPIAKVESLKTRVFAHGPMDFTLAFRKYFLGFIAHVMENRIFNEQSIGTNVYSRDWAETAKKLQLKGKKVIAGDFSTFDGTLNAGILSTFADVVSDWYADGEENRTLRHVLMQDIYNSQHLVHDTFYQMNHSQPSGNPATTILNSFYNSVSMRMVFRICARKANKPMNMQYFNEHVSMVSYGDDNVVNMSDAVVSWFNQNTITQGYSQIGMIYTDEAKTGDATPDYRTISEVGYLKRNFIRRGNRWFAPLDLNTILEMCNWRRGDTDPITATQVNCECAIMELSQHAKNVWNTWEPKIQTAFMNASGSMLDTMSYEEYEEKRLQDYFM